MESDVTLPIPNSVWVSMGGSDGYWQEIVVESKISNCSRCKVHGHELSNCRKAKASQGYDSKKLEKSGYGPDILYNVTTRRDIDQTVKEKQKDQQPLQKKKRKTVTKRKAVRFEPPAKESANSQPAPVPIINL